MYFDLSDESQVEPDEVPEEEGVAERSEVKEEAEEPEMKVSCFSSNCPKNV